MKFRKKPVVVEAIRWSGTNLKEVIEFTGLHPSANKWTWEEYEAVVSKDGFKIFTLEGPHLANVGDYIIKGVKGEFYACKPDIFEMTYEDAAALIDQPEEVASRSRLKRIAAQGADARDAAMWKGRFDALLAVVPDRFEAQGDDARDAAQAKIDSLMMEFCPDEMTPEQIENWGRNQRAVTHEESALINQPEGAAK